MNEQENIKLLWEFKIAIKDKDQSKNKIVETDCQHIKGKATSLTKSEPTPSTYQQ